jgi:ribose transport system ATP-binding protein
VMSAGRMTGMFERGSWTQDALLAAAFAGYTKRDALLHDPIEPDARAPHANAPDAAAPDAVAPNATAPDKKSVEY